MNISKKAIYSRFYWSILWGMCLSFSSISTNAQTMNEVTDVVTKLFIATDRADWKTVKNCFAPKVHLDYSSMTGAPSSELASEEIIQSWKGVLPKFEHTHHQLGNFTSKIEGKSAQVFCYGTASHFSQNDEGNLWTVVGSYDFKLLKNQVNKWEISSMKFNFKYQTGNLNLPQLALNQLNNKNMKKVTFKSEGLTLVGNLYYPTNYEEGKSYPAIIVSGSWTTVKEQMAGLYAQKFAEKGFITLAFDFRNFGESEGEPRFYESPELKKTDIKNAVTFLENLPEISGTQIGVFGVCAGAMYTLMASAEEPRIKAVATTASWLHDAEAIKLFYGGEEGVNAKIEQAKSAKKKYAETGIIDYIPSISITDETAAMYGNYDYYLNPERGAIPQWSADKFAVMSWEDWLTADPMPTAEKLTQPTLMIHSDGAVLPQYTKNYFNKISNSDKKLHWMKTDLDSPFHQFNYYDQEVEVQEAVQEASNWFTEKL